jgi:hypothetical protein
MVLAACSSSSTPPTKPTPATPDAAVSSDAPPDANLADLPNATVSMFRFHQAGEPARIETWTLKVAGDRAVVLVDRTPARSSTYAGSANDDGTTIAIAVTEGPNKLSLACKRAKLDVAAATAKRAAQPKKKGKCDPGRWAPDKLTKLDVLECKHPDFEAPMPFAAEPGVEYLTVTDECFGAGYRVIAKDGAIAPAR